MDYSYSILYRFGFFMFLFIQPVLSYSQEYDAVLLKQLSNVEIVKNKLIQTHYFRIRIFNRKGDRYAKVIIPYNKISRVSDISASIYDNLGNKVQKLKKSDIIQRSAVSNVSFYTDTYVNEFSMRNQTYPYTFEYSYTEEDEQFVFLSDWMPVIDHEVPTIQATLKMNVPVDYPVFYRSNELANPEIDTVAGRIYYIWNASYTNILSDEIWSPEIHRFLPNVEIVPDQFRYECAGSNSSWNAYGAWNLSLLDGLDELPVSERIKIHSLTDSIQGEKEKIRELFHYLQDATRYISVSIKTGGMKPYPASYVAEKKYGDCKALANYFKACLSVIGIRSDYTLIKAGEVIDPIDTGFPSQQFNHVILLIPLQQDSIWLDCTSDLAFGYLGTFTQNRKALVLGLNECKLVSTPALSYDDILETRKINILLNADNSMQCDFKGTCRGYKYELLSGILSEFNESERKQYVARYIIDPGFEMENYSIIMPGRDDPEAILAFTASADHFVKVYGNEAMLKIIPLQFNTLEEPKKRQMPVQVNYPVNKSDSIIYSIPACYKVSAIPENVKISSAYGEYEAGFSRAGNTVQVAKRFVIKSGTIGVKDYPEFYNFRNRIIEAENSLYITLLKQ